MAYKLIYLARRNPTVSAEDWPHTWRSHAVFASQFPAIESRFDGLFYCARILEPSLGGAAVDVPGAATDYDGVALASAPSAESLQVKLDPESRAQVDRDELRVFSTYTPEFTLRCHEDWVWGGAAGKAAVIRFLTRQSASTPEDFHAHWNGDYADRVRDAAEASGSVLRHVHNRPIEAPPPGYAFDGISETWFADPEAAVSSLLDAPLAPLGSELATFCEPAHCVTLLTRVIHRWQAR